MHHGVKYGFAVQQRVRRAVAQRKHRRKMAAVKADLTAPVSVSSSQTVRCTLSQ